MKHQIKRRLYISPVQTIVLGFFINCCRHDLINDAFFCTSWTKRNGLMLFVNFRRLCYRAFAFEYGGTLSPIGQVIIMILIELGGLGF